MGALRNAAILAAGVALLTAPGSLASTAPATTALASADWGTYGFNVSRGGFNPYEKKIDSRSVHRLRQAWSFRLGSAIDTQPLVASNVPVPVGGRHARVMRDLVIAGSENGRLAAVNATTGRRVWFARARRGGYPRVPRSPALREHRHAGDRPSH